MVIAIAYPARAESDFMLGCCQLQQLLRTHLHAYDNLFSCCALCLAGQHCNNCNLPLLVTTKAQLTKSWHRCMLCPADTYCDRCQINIIMLKVFRAGSWSVA
jgi:hypothetical protein